MPSRYAPDQLRSELPELVVEQRIQGSQATRYVLRLPDHNAVEAVKIRRHDGYTACVSSQVGCGFGCRFCASGRNGLRRHLTPEEIVAQVVALGRGVNRVVFMGIGEPLHNYEGVRSAIHVLRDRDGIALPTSAITISTIGVPDGLRRLREEHLRINLTVSLHATTDEIRHRLIPGARGHELAEVVDRSLSWAYRHRRPVTYGYLLLPGVNDSSDDRLRLGRLLAGHPARVNLMRWNPVEGGDRFERVSDRTLTWFRDGLVRAGVQATVRDTQGRDVDAACGQLWLHRADRRDPPAGRRADDRSTPTAR